MNVQQHYDERYFARQNAGGDLRGVANAFKFSRFIPPGAGVLDFGCGSGALLEALGVDKAASAGVEPNPHAAAVAKSRGFKTFSELSEAPRLHYDGVISHHALEHVIHPFAAIQSMHEVLKRDGLIVIVVPCDSPSFPYRPDDPDLHLYSWSSNNLGNIVRAAGFHVLTVGELRHKWPPYWMKIQRALGWSAFHFCSSAWARLDRRRNQVRVVAQKL